MKARSYVLRDSATMLRRNLLHLRRYPSLTVFLVATPVVILLVFVGVFGGALAAGIGAHARGGGYLGFLVPGMILIAIAGTAQITAIAVAMDMSGGIVARFRTMAIARASVLTGHVVASVLQAVLSVAVTLLVAVLVGYRPSATPAAWLGVFGMVGLTAIAVTWLAVALGLAADSVETASNLPMFLMLLPFLGSGFVPTDSMPGPVRTFADLQPFTPIIDTIRGLLDATPTGNSAAIAVGWCVAITLGAAIWSARLYERDAVGAAT